ncbi:hypothetical protein BY996DRAFT_6408439 [Phakopsora pachyrhizi]|nr:hypothetical protein BY996DRAFT_6408439 [Phakopsora pachyrhizi]
MNPWRKDIKKRSFLVRDWFFSFSTLLDRELALPAFHFAISCEEDNKRLLKMYVQLMKVPANDIKLILLDALLEIFQIKTSTWYGTFMSGRRLIYYQKPGQQFNFSNPPPNTGNDIPTEKVLD